MLDLFDKSSILTPLTILNVYIVIVILIFGMIGCFGFSSSLRQYYSVYRAIYQREREKKIISEKKYPNNCHMHLLQAQ